MKQDLRIAQVLERSRMDPPKLKSDFSRSNADVIAMCASEGFITTKIATGFYGTRWLITPLGLSHLLTINGEHH
jgi:hypothetical protein